MDAKAFEKEALRILKEVEEECGWMYETWHPNCDDPNRVKGKINFTIWSDVFACPQCGTEMVFWDVAVDHNKGEVRDNWNCSKCAAILAKNPAKGSGAQKVERAWETVYDQTLSQAVRRAKQVPVLINYNFGKQRLEKRPDFEDKNLIQKISDGNTLIFSQANGCLMVTKVVVMTISALPMSIIFIQNEIYTFYLQYGIDYEHKNYLPSVISYLRQLCHGQIARIDSL